MKRRAFLGHGASALLLVTGCRGAPPARDAVLTALVREVVVPDVREVVDASAKLETAVKALAAAPTVAALVAARAAFRPALFAWKRAQCFRLGPMVETNAFVRTLFWPVRGEGIEATISGSAAIDEAFVNNLGVDKRGLYALEYLLFPLEQADDAAAARYAGDAAKRRRELVLALASGVTLYAAKAASALGDGAAFAAHLAKGAQVNLSILVNQMIATIENLTAHRLERVLVLGLADSRLGSREIEGFPSASSHEIVLAQLTGSERLYRGAASGGLAGLTRAVAPAIDERVSERYAAALSAVRALKQPLERVAAANRATLAAAAAATKALELALKVDLASALGVTITFQTGDGD